MNLVAVTSWVIQETARRFRADGSSVLTWRGGVRDRAKGEHVLNFEIADVALMEEAEPRLLPGQTYLIEDAEIVTRPYKKSGVVVANIEVIAVRAMTFGKTIKTPEVAQKITEETKAAFSIPART